ncbi:hypothetical protein BGX26_008386 [Mortierella sp. AD094]|nr:hypothetical protein BGX26_008386 [Mortierella sp. AD094]
MFFLLRSLPLEAPFSLMLGLTFTGGICISERIVTSRLEKVSMKLIQLQQPHGTRSFATAGSNIPSVPFRSSNTPLSDSTEIESTQQHDAQTTSTNPAVRGQTSWSAPSSNTPNSFQSPCLGKGKSGSLRALMVQKMFLYGLANVLRLSYMLLAMSFHIGVLAVIVSSLTCTQLYLDVSFDHGSSTREKSGSSGYELLGMSEGDETRGVIGNHQGRASVEGSALYDLDGNQGDQLGGAIPLRNNVALTRSLDCF